MNSPNKIKTEPEPEPAPKTKTKQKPIRKPKKRGRKPKPKPKPRKRGFARPHSDLSTSVHDFDLEFEEELINDVRDFLVDFTYEDSRKYWLFKWMHFDSNIKDRTFQQRFIEDAVYYIKYVLHKVVEFYQREWDNRGLLLHAGMKYADRAEPSPLGVGLESWKVPKENFRAINWWLFKERYPTNKNKFRRNATIFAKMSQSDNPELFKIKLMFDKVRRDLAGTLKRSPLNLSEFFWLNAVEFVRSVVDKFMDPESTYHKNLYRFLIEKASGGLGFLATGKQRYSFWKSVFQGPKEDMFEKFTALTKEGAAISDFEAGQAAAKMKPEPEDPELANQPPPVKPAVTVPPPPTQPAVLVPPPDLTSKPSNAIDDPVLSSFAGNNSVDKAPLPVDLPLPALGYDTDATTAAHRGFDTEDEGDFDFGGYEAEDEGYGTEATGLMSEVTHQMQEHVICDPSGEPIKKIVTVPVGPKIPTKKWSDPPGGPGRGPPTELEAAHERKRLPTIAEEYPSENQPKSLFMPMAAAFGFLFLAYVISDVRSYT